MRQIEGPFFYGPSPSHNGWNLIEMWFLAKDTKTVPSRRGNRGGSKMPTRSPAKRGGNVGKRSTRGSRGRGGASRGGQRGARTNLSTQEAQKRLIQAKRTLQAAIQV